MTNLCPCGSTETYSDCCQLLHANRQYAKTAEQLMRSRYCAFYQGVKGLEGMSDYLAATHHPEQRQPSEQQDLEKAFKHQNWLSLRIVKTEKGLSKDKNGKVEFVAFYEPDKSADKVGQLHENSNFKKNNDQWFYVDGEILPEIKLKRNDLCWCGGGKKFKQCHGG